MFAKAGILLKIPQKIIQYPAPCVKAVYHTKHTVSKRISTQFTCQNLVDDEIDDVNRLIVAPTDHAYYLALLKLEVKNSSLDTKYLCSQNLL